MRSSTRGLPLAAFAELVHMDRDCLRSILYRGQLKLPSLKCTADRVERARHYFQFDDALAAEIANSLHTDNGMPIGEALRIVADSLAVTHFRNYVAKFAAPGKPLADYWIGVTRWRVADTSDAREAWSRAPFGGPHHCLMADVARISEQVQASNPGAELVRLEIANASAAERRVRARAAQMNIHIVGDKFVGRY